MVYDIIIIGAGLYGFYAGLTSGKQGKNVLILEIDDEPFSRATYVNQARVHQGYHYPRSLATAEKSARYFEKFNRDYAFCIYSNFSQIYATSLRYSWTNSDQFLKFCRAAGIGCEEVLPGRYFKNRQVDGAFLTRENSYDARLLKQYFLDAFSRLPQVSIRYSAELSRIEQSGRNYDVVMADGEVLSTGFLLNTTYASSNQIIKKAGFSPFSIKYELCEIILCRPGEQLRKVGITVMDGPFFSVMPFGRTGLHSLTAVSFTPQLTCYDLLPTFPCQEGNNNVDCSPERLRNCNTCPNRPKSSWPYMSQLASSYLNDSLKFDYVESLYSIKPILLVSEVDDSRPTVIRKHSEDPAFYSVLSGKINTLYDLDEVL